MPRWISGYDYQGAPAFLSQAGLLHSRSVRLPDRFLVIDENTDSRFLLVKTLLRKFPSALLQECHDADTAIATARSDKLTAIVAHRTYDYDGVTLVALLRRANPTVPIVMVSGIDRTPQALAAGANAFLSYDEWLRIGSVVGEVLEKPEEPPGASAMESRRRPAETSGRELTPAADGSAPD